MSTNTYVALDKITVGTATPTVTFTSIPQGYTDLIIEMSGSTSGSINNTIRVGNGSVDTGSNYSCTIISGNGSTAVSTRRLNDTSFQPNYNGYTTTGQSDMTIHFQNYSNTSVYKTMLSRSNNASTGVDGVVGLWRSTSAINTIQLLANGGYNWQVGTTFSLYGIAASGVSPAAKATGGTIYSDATYYYHAFTSSGTFTPLQSLSADVLVVAGGGGGGDPRGGGGGAGGVLLLSSQSLSATGYTCTVGAGGGVGTGQRGTNGSNSTFGGLTAAVGGGGGAGDSNSSGSSGGSGGGALSAGTAGSATSGQGYAGGTGLAYVGGGGGGAGAAGQTAPSSSQAGNGGVGTAAYNSWSLATGMGQNISGTYYFAGGGGGGWGPSSGTGTAGTGGYGGGGNGQVQNGTAATAGAANTGGGGGAGGGVSGSTYGTPASGGSGIIIVRYAK